MRMMVFFDLPATSAQERREVRLFRKGLLKNGFRMMQESVYLRTCVGKDSVEKYRKRIQDVLPSSGSVRLLVLTEQQYSSMENLLGEDRDIPCSRLLVI